MKNGEEKFIINLVFDCLTCNKKGRNKFELQEDENLALEENIYAYTMNLNIYHVRTCL